VPSLRRQTDPGLSALLVFVGAIVVAAVVMALAGMFGSDTTGASTPGPAAVAPVPQGAGASAPAGPALPQIAVVKRTTSVRARPGGGRRLARIGTKTVWNAPNWRNPRVLPVLERRGDWIRVIVTELANGRTGWISTRDVQLGSNTMRIDVDLSRRLLTVMDGGSVIRRVRTAVGEQGTPTPTGTFAVTDRFNFIDAGSVYGCCALALSAHQSNLQQGWTGGDRVAIHATPEKASIGQAQTHGCMRVPDKDAAWMIGNVPLGTVVRIRS
jgi:lipoprotein-anchoring transpeptidase ErfK/SrfK